MSGSRVTDIHVFTRGPARYRSRVTGRYVSEDFAREHPDEAHAVNRRPVAPLIPVLAIGVLGLAAAAAIVYRSRR